MKIVAALLLIASCAGNRRPASGQYLSWAEYFKKEVLQQTDLEKVFPDVPHLSSWQKSTEVVVDPATPRPVDLSFADFQCLKNKYLYPAHPQQDSKEYLYGAYANYQHHKLPVNSRACQTPNPTRRFCLRATYAQMIIMSDIYEDACGNFYRGYWLTSFLKSEESMGTLFSKGKTAYENPRAQFPGEYVMGGTYPVSKDEFLFFSKLRAGDAATIKRGRAEAARLGFRRENLLFISTLR